MGCRYQPGDLFAWDWDGDGRRLYAIVTPELLQQAVAIADRIGGPLPDWTPLDSADPAECNHSIQPAERERIR